MYRSSDILSKNPLYYRIIIEINFIFIIINLIMDLNTGYYDYGDVVNDRQKVTANYFKKFFWKDIILIIVLLYI